MRKSSRNRKSKIRVSSLPSGATRVDSEGLCEVRSSRREPLDNPILAALAKSRSRAIRNMTAEAVFQQRGLSGVEAAVSSGKLKITPQKLGGIRRKSGVYKSKRA